MGSVILSPGGLIGGGISAPRGGPSVPIGTPQDLGHNQAATGVSALTITTTNNILAGDLLCVVHYSASLAGTFASGGDGTNTLARVFGPTAATPMIEVYATYNAQAVASGASLTCNFSGGTSIRHAISAFRCAGIATAAADQITNQSTGTATSSGLLTFPDLSLPNELLVAIFAGASDPGTRTWGTGYAAVGGNTATAFALPAWLAVTSATGNTVQPAWVNSVAYRTVAVSFKGLSQP